jgi:hypothetical protein
MVKADEGVQILLDVGGDETTYHGFFVTQANTLRDESVSIPGAPVDYNPWRRLPGPAALESSCGAARRDRIGTCRHRAFVGPDRP